MYPMPILVVLGMRHVAAKLRGFLVRTDPKEVSGRLSRAMPVLALVLVLLGSVLPWAYVPDWQYFPGDAGYKQLVQIRDAYGYGNGQVIVLIDQRYFENALTWTSAVTGAQVYPGNLLSLLRGDPFRRDLHRWFPPDMNGVTEILLPASLYNPDSMEKGLLSVGTAAPGVPYYRVTAGFNASSYLLSAGLAESNSFWTSWTLQTSSLSQTFSTANSRLNWTLPGQSPSPTPRSVSYVRPLSNRTAESLYFLVSGSLNGVEGSINLDYQSGNSASYALDRILPGPLLIRMRLSGGEVPKQLRVTFALPESRASQDSWTQISYLGLVTP
jgi:hypothetical protein